MLTILYVKHNGRPDWEVIAQIESLTEATVMGYTLEGEVFGLRLKHDDPEDFSVIPDLEGEIAWDDDPRRSHDDFE